MKIKDGIIIGLLVLIFSVLVVGRGKRLETEDASSTLQDMNIDEQMRKIEDASSALQDMNIDELMRKICRRSVKVYHPWSIQSVPP